MKKTILAFTLVALLHAVPALAQRQRPLDLDRIMSNQTQVAAGINKLSPSERSALEQWVADWSRGVYDAAVQNTLKSSTPRASAKVYSGVGGRHWISKVIRNGTYIELEDGSLWEVASLDRVYTSIWLPVSDIRVVEANSSVGSYQYLLVNVDSGEQASAKLIDQ